MLISRKLWPPGGGAYITEKVGNIVAKGKIACFEQFLLLSPCFQKLSAADAWKCAYRGKIVNSIHIQVLSDASAADNFRNMHVPCLICQIMENLYDWMDNLKVENIVAKEEIACFEQFLLLWLCFQKAVCCRGVGKRLY